MPATKTKLTERSGVIGKECSKCDTWKPLEEFCNNAKGLGGKQSNCRECDRLKAEKRRKENNEELNEYRRDHYKRNKDKLNEQCKEWQKRNKEHLKEYGKKYREEHKDKRNEYSRQYSKDNIEEMKVKNQRRRARKKALPDTWTKTDRKYALKIFGGCALTGSKDIHLDHVIPLVTGHGGTTRENMIPLRSDLNLSKSNRNLFEWFYEVKEQFNLSQAKFNALIDYLSNLNGMTPVEYEKYVYDCFQTPV